MVPLSSLESLKQWAMKFHAHLFEESTPKSQSKQIALSWLIDLFLFTCIHGNVANYGIVKLLQHVCIGFNNVLFTVVVWLGCTVI